MISTEFPSVLILCLIGLFLSERLATTGVIGILTRDPMIYNFPFGFLRPSFYLLILQILLLPWAEEYLGHNMAVLLIAILALDFLVEWARIIYRPTISFGSISPPLLHQALEDILPTLKVNVSGKFPKYKIQQNGDEFNLTIRTMPALNKATISISSFRATSLLSKVVSHLDQYFAESTVQTTLRGFFVNLVFAAALFLLCFLQILRVVLYN